MPDTTGNGRADIAVRTLGPFPPAVRAGFRCHRRMVLATAAGRVLDLGGVDPELDAYRPDAVTSLTYLAQRRADRVAVLEQGRRLGLAVQLAGRVPASSPGHGFDTVVCTGRLAGADDPAALAARLAALLGGDGRLLVVEPSLGAGWDAALGRWSSPFTRGAVGWNPALDVPGILRRAGLVVTDLERSTITTLALPMRSVVRAVARPRPTPDPPTGHPPTTSLEAP